MGSKHSHVNATLGSQEISLPTRYVEGLFLLTSEVRPRGIRQFSCLTWVGWDVNVQVNRLTRDVNECIRDYVFAFVCRTNWGSANTLNKLAELAANCWCEKMSLFSKRVCNQLFLNVPINQLWRTQSHANTSEHEWCCLIHKVEIL